MWHSIKATSYIFVMIPKDIDLPKLGDELLAKLPPGSGILLMVVYPSGTIDGTSNMPIDDTIELAERHIRQMEKDKLAQN